MPGDTSAGSKVQGSYKRKHSSLDQQFAWVAGIFFFQLAAIELYLVHLLCSDFAGIRHAEALKM